MVTHTPEWFLEISFVGDHEHCKEHIGPFTHSEMHTWLEKHDFEEKKPLSFERISSDETGLFLEIKEGDHASYKGREGKIRIIKAEASTIWSPTATVQITTAPTVTVQ